MRTRRGAISSVGRADAHVPRVQPETFAGFHLPHPISCHLSEAVLSNNEEANAFTENVFNHHLYLCQELLHPPELSYTEADSTASKTYTDMAARSLSRALPHMSK